MKSNLRQEEIHKIFRRILLGSIVLIIGAIILSLSLWGWWVYSQMGGLSWGGGLIFFAVIGWTTIGTIIMIIGLILAVKWLIIKRKKSNYSPLSELV